MEYIKCWLDYQEINLKNQNDICYATEFSGSMADNAIAELQEAFKQFYGRRLVQGANPRLILRQNQYLRPEAYRIVADGKCVIEAADQRGLLYGVFALLRQLVLQQVQLKDLVYNITSAPANPLRMLNHWDNLDGSIERGYSGGSFFFRDGRVLVSQRTRDYARLCASVGINAVVLNNVNVDDAASWLISDRHYAQLRQIQQIFAGYNITMYLSVNFAAPITMGGLPVSDPLSFKVQRWWKEKADEVWENLPGLGGFLVKADSEGRPGPHYYGRTHALGANMLADAVAPYGGKIIWRCFVYNCMQDWRDKKTDRARAAYDNFMPLDGQFRDNVILQIKNGPMDFQVREPVNPLFGGLKHTNMILEFQIAQEYTGQQRHVCYLLPWFREVLDQDMGGGVGRVASAIRQGQPGCFGIAAVANTGSDKNWTGHDLAAANWYGFGRLAWDPAADSLSVAQEWIMLTYGREIRVVRVLSDILMNSWKIYEMYTSPLGIGWMVHPHHHYGPCPEGYEYDRWGTYHRADHRAIGIERNEFGTGYCQQYNEPWASIYSSLRTCPDELLLFFHRVHYDHVLSSGKTVIQHIYDTHFQGARQAYNNYLNFQSLRSYLPKDAFYRIDEQMLHQVSHSREWRDVINSYFYRKTGIPDALSREIF